MSNDVSGKKLVIACGGTGGHLFPGIGVAEAWRQRGGEVLLLISEKQIDTLAAEGYRHLQFERIPTIGLPSLFSPKMIGFVSGFLKTFKKCRKLFREAGADVVLGMGGFTSTPPLMAGKTLKLPTYIHESNAIPGRANLLNAKFADAVLVGFEICASRFQGRRTAVVGTPLRPSMVKKPSREEALEFFGLSPDRRTVMIMGGSQGALRINELVAQSLDRLIEANIQVLHITGPRDYEKMTEVFLAKRQAGTVVDFLNEVQYAYAVADLAICRAGASSSTELAYYGLPAVLIPFPYAADDHQTANAEIFSIPGAAELWKQSELDEKSFTDNLIALIDDKERLAKMGQKMKELAIPDASDQICDVLAASLVFKR